MDEYDYVLNQLQDEIELGDYGAAYLLAAKLCLTLTFEAHVNEVRVDAPDGTHWIEACDDAAPEDAMLKAITMMAYRLTEA